MGNSAPWLLHPCSLGSINCIMRYLYDSIIYYYLIKHTTTFKTYKSLYASILCDKSGCDYVISLKYIDLLCDLHENLSVKFDLK